MLLSVLGDCVFAEVAYVDHNNRCGQGEGPDAITEGQTARAWSLVFQEDRVVIAGPESWQRVSCLDKVDDKPGVSKAACDFCGPMGIRDDHRNLPTDFRHWTFPPLQTLFLPLT